MRLTTFTILCLTVTAAVSTKVSRRKRISQDSIDEDLNSSRHGRVKRFIGREEIIGIVGTILELWDLIDTRLASNDIDLGDVFSNLGNVSFDFSFVDRKQAQLTQRILDISQQLNRIEATLAHNADYTIDAILTAIPKIVRTELRLHDLKSVINQINLQDREMQRYLSNQSAIERHTLEDWALAVSSHHQDSIRNLMAKLHEDVSPDFTTALPYSVSIFRLISQMDSNSFICELQQSQQELIYHMYNIVGLAELKGYTMLQFAWMLLKIYEKGNFSAEAEIMRNLYMERTNQKVIAAKEAMASADRSLYRCDPKEWIEGDNYVRLTKLLQGYIENEVNLNSEGTCGQNCKYYDVTEYHGCFKNQFCAKQRPCHGQVLHCTYYDSDMNICQSSSGDRRYDWIEYENRKILGQKGSCPNSFMTKVDSWWRYLFWHCSYCFCLCDDNHPSSDRYFNLRETTSDVENNKVITGVRLVKNNQVIHIQVQEGLLEERGLINKTRTEWLPIRGYNVMDENIKSGIDFHVMDYRQRGIDLDDAVGPTSHILTGVRFRRIGNHLNLEVAVTPFDFATGKLRPSVEAQWIANDNTDASFNAPRSEVTLADPDIPTRHGPHLPISKHDQFMVFRESSQVKDAAQSTVPYLDAQPVTSGGMALAGLGLHHRGALSSGGFIALKLITYDYSPHMLVQTTDNNVA